MDSQARKSPASDGKAPRTARGERTFARSSMPLETSSASAASPRARSSQSRSAPASRSVLSIPISIRRRRCSERSCATCPRRCATPLRRLSGTRPARSTAHGGLERSSASRGSTGTFIGSSTNRNSSIQPLIASITKRPPTRIAARFVAARDDGEHRSGSVRRRPRNPGLGVHGCQRIPRPSLFGLVQHRPAARRSSRQSAPSKGSFRMSEAVKPPRHDMTTAMWSSATG